MNLEKLRDVFEDCARQMPNVLSVHYTDKQVAIDAEIERVITWVFTEKRIHDKCKDL